MKKLFATTLILVATTIMAFNVNALTCPDLDGASVFSQETNPVYLGFFGSAYASESIMNSYGRYGSAYGTDSVRNEFGAYGSPYRSYSATNPYTSTPPKIFKNNSVIGYLTANSLISFGISLPAIDASCTFYSNSPSNGSSGLPSPPALVTASDGSYVDKVALSWSSVTSATAYNVYSSTSFGSEQGFLGQTANTAVNVTGLQPGDVWYFWVYSVNAYGQSIIGSYDTGYVQSNALPEPPTQVDASDGTFPDKIVVSWSSVATANSYNVYYSTSVDSTQSLLGQFTSTSVNVTGTSPGDVWYFWVYSVNANGESTAGTYDTGYVQPEAVTSTDLTITTFNVTENTSQSGGYLVVNNITENIGSTDSSAYRISFYASTDTNITSDDIYIWSFDRDPLTAGESHNRNSSFSQMYERVPDGTYYIGGILEIDDADNNNNTNYDPTPVTVDSSLLSFQMNAGLNDAWYYPVTTGQGFYITVFPEIGYVALSWFTYDNVRPDEGITANLGEPGHRWLNAIGAISGNKAVMDVSYGVGGIFDSSTETTEVSDGTITLTFTDCSTGTVEYDIPSINQQGVVPIQRITNDNVALCEQLAEQSSTQQISASREAEKGNGFSPETEKFWLETQQLTEMNAGLNDAWYYPVTTGQGFYITVFPEIGYVALSWFTYDNVRPDEGITANLGEPGHRWLNAIGAISGNKAVMDISYGVGGIFDSSTETTEVSDGTITLTFTDCSTGTVEYDIPSINQQGVVPIQRITNDNVALCEALSSVQ